MRVLLLILFILCGAFFADQVQASDRVISLGCKPTPEVEYPEQIPHFQTRNNLRNKVGMLFQAQGEPIVIYGKVFDSSCTPITNATVRIWHTNTYGTYQTNTSSNDEEKYDTNFMGSGAVSTDNFGNYSFITIMPGTYKRRAPHVNMVVMSEGFLPFQTQMFFADDPLNDKDEILNSIPSESRDLLLAKPVHSKKDENEYYEFNITLQGKNKYKHY